MPVIETFRKGLDSTGTKAFIGIVVAAFVLWGVGGQSSQRTTIYVTVNGVTLTDTDVLRPFQAAARQRGGNLSESEQDQLFADVLEELIRQQVLLQEAERLGLAVSPTEIARELKKQEVFFGDDGKFSEKTYERVLKQSGLTPARYEKQLHDALMIQKLQDLATRGVDVSEVEVRRAWEERATTANLSFVRVPESAFLESIPVDDAELAAFVQANGDKLKQRYDAAFERQYNLPKRYTLSTILLRTDIAGVEPAEVRARAEAIRAQAEGGADFADLARRWSEDLTAAAGGNLGTQSADQLDPVVVKGADAAGAGKVSAVLETARGLQVVKVAAIDEAKVIPFEEARDDIARTLVREGKVGDVARAWASSLLTEWQAGGVAPAARLDEKRLRVETTGEFSLADPQVPRLGAATEIRAALKGTPSGGFVPMPIKVGDAWMVVQVTHRTDPDPAKYATESTTVRAGLRYAKREAFVQAWVDELVAKARIERTPRGTKG